MELPPLLSRLVLLFLLLILFLSSFPSSKAAATTTRITQNRMPGFVFTRTRGKCTPQFWSSGREAWPRMVPQESTVSKVFGSRVNERYGSDLTLLEATVTNYDEENGYPRLLKQASAALLNSYARKGFPYSAWEIKTLVIQALVSEEAANLQAQLFSIANEDCD
ncbi:uncharacterized protein LOC126698446 [Quercus robur]|uniref:uncharacterized protein LOC126698446 n=1 Tax=Quercus robur TaxID=38942 RepID=UPI002161E244|nr:uncharacterized protein LOC126698446 [Quercus robur]